MKINQYLYQNFGGDIGLLWKSPFTLKGNFDKHFDSFSLKFLIITIELFKTISRADWDLGLTGILGSLGSWPYGRYIPSHVCKKIA